MGFLTNLFNKRNVFDLSHERKFSCDMGKLIPILCEEVLPGDTFKVQTDMIVRLSALIAPMMHRVNVFTHYFFVPNRLIWDNWQNFITGGVQGDNASEMPVITNAHISEGTLADYFGLPVGVTLDRACALPFRAYTAIYNEWFRDQNLQSPLPINKNDGPDSVVDFETVLKRNWEKDYFTSALPWPQRGPAVTVGLSGNAPVTVSGNIHIPSTNLTVEMYTPGGDPVSVVTIPSGQTDRSIRLSDASVPSTQQMGGHTASQDPEVALDGEADLTEVNSITINSLRQAFQVQKWLERNARAGARYVESILSHFGVRSSDARLQRPEFLGGGKSPIVVSEVLQTSSSDATTPQGNLAGHGYSAQRSHEFTKSFEEHGYIIGLLSVLPRTAYQQGVPRMWNRRSRYDFYWPEFAHLGEQAVINRELYYQDDDDNPETGNDGVFGYQGRYDEYRRRESSVHGDFKTSLDFWHMGRKFASRPHLNADFVASDPTVRNFAVTSHNVLQVQLVNQVEAIRPIPKIAEPGLIDHS